MSTEETPIIMTAFYMGLRPIKGGGLGYTWDFAGRERIWAKQLAPAAIGEEWAFSVTPAAGDGLSVITGGKAPPKQTGGWAPKEMALAWEGAHVANQQIAREEKANKQLTKRKSAMVKACEPLLHMLQATRGYVEREAFIRAVIQELRNGL